MAEYWISKKQYWCKYCNIWVRDDAPSRQLHETGLKHQGGKERFLRDLYKGGQRAKREKEMEAAEMARIESSAAAAYAKDTAGPSASGPSKPSITQRIALATSASRLRPPSAPADKYANYSTASQLGFDDEETQKSSYEIEQELKGRKGEAGAWVEVEIPGETPIPTTYDSQGFPTNIKGKRKLRDPFGPGGGGDLKLEEEEAENFKFNHEDKRIVNDIYDDDGWDPKRSLTGLKIKVKEEQMFSEGKRKEAEREREKAARKEEEDRRIAEAGGLKREEWSGKLELRPVEKGKQSDKAGLTFIPDGGSVKAENGVPTENDKVAEAGSSITPNGDKIPSGEEATIKSEPLEPTEEPDAKLPPSYANDGSAAASSSTLEPSAGGLFKKRRPPPQRKK